MTNRSARRLFRFGAIVLMGLLSTLTATAKSVADVVVLKNGDRMTGEIKGLQRGELRFKSDNMADEKKEQAKRVAAENGV